MDAYGRNPGAPPPPRPDPDTGLEGSMWQLGLEDAGGRPYPERLGKPDCSYYLRTGTCGYGDRCRYNHPIDRGTVAGPGRDISPDYPERAGQPACQYFLKTGTCKYGATCKYDHPKQGGFVRPVSLNYYGYPLRPGEKECPYYMRTGQCKFGSTCKFHHPQDTTTASVPSSPQAFYPGPPHLIPTPHQYQAIDGTRPSVLPASYVPGPYGPLLVSPGIVPFSGWTPYPPSVSPMVSPGGQPSIQAGSLDVPTNQLSYLAPAYQGMYSAVSAASAPSSSTQNEHIYLERAGQPECQYYMRLGYCKFGSACKYHHPPRRSLPETSSALNPVGLPLRPGAPLCNLYVQYGECKFGLNCMFDHPVGTLSYSFSASSLPDMTSASYPTVFSMSTLASSSSSSELRHEFISSTDAFSTRMPFSEEKPSGSIGSAYPRGRYLPHSLVQIPSQTSGMSRSSNSTDRSGKMSSSS